MCGRKLVSTFCKCVKTPVLFISFHRRNSFAVKKRPVDYELRVPRLVIVSALLALTSFFFL